LLFLLTREITPPFFAVISVRQVGVLPPGFLGFRIAANTLALG
jgi:hypothetical protein